MTQNIGAWSRASAVLVSAGLCVTVAAAERRPDPAPARVAPAALQADAPIPDMGAPEVSLARIKGVRGETVFLPLVVFQDDLKVTKVTSEVTFPTATVTYEGFDRYPSQDPLLKIDAALVPGIQDKDRGVVRLEIASGRDQQLPEGALLKLKFRLSDKMPAGMLDLKHAAKAVTVDGKTITAFGRDGSVEVAEIQVYSCFFYMH